MVQVLVMTSKGKHNIIKGFFRQWQRYYQTDCNLVVCGFFDDKKLFTNIMGQFPISSEYYAIGHFSDYPASKWSDAFLRVLDNVADDRFILMLDDYWLYRQTDLKAIGMIYDYMHQFQNVLKFDLTDERLYSGTPPDGYNQFYWGHNTYETLGYLDLIKSDPNSLYHMSLWGGMWRRDLLKEIVIPDERAQEIEMRGGSRLLEHPEWLILGTRQAPMRHANVIQRNEWNQDARTGLPVLKNSDYDDLEALGCFR